MNAARRVGPVRRRQAGYALLEAAVALLVLGLGLLGVAKTQALVLKSTYSSGQRSLVSLSAASLAAAMEGNPAYWRGLARGRTTALTVSVTPASDGGVTLSQNDLTTATRDCSAGTCSTTELAAYDLKAWAANLQSQLGDALIGASLVLQPPDGAGAVNAALTIQWRENLPAIHGSTGGTSNQSLTHYVQP
ncbi:hypothetical protein [uncultured Aquabacterium sp.]|jgi:type IV pilus assembly protein PilV|uniref:hypothetical protein n=1 Tax=uncultured Aquabacterium sp. TaxID=158753 RepID=UPI00262F50C4|nr:hypothetical protein [uncultured Aquabacterium sp.]